MEDLKGKVALITGASAGIGEATAKHFAALGCWLSLTGRNAANLDRVAAACSDQGIPRDKVLVVPGDIAVATDVADVVQKTVDHFGRIDILVLEKKAAATQAIKRAGTPEEVARCIAFLASDDSAFITGITMPMDAGMGLLSSISGVTLSQNAQDAS
ncbi:hypothetical protein HPB50_009870 [Hyalomma asiaticum]|uniref:Uncharacterized protein n=1 Tax=Hyalomma asiaticum TaxID=266040 RepID=A0ACB7SFY4_HYAAI|nr:hypothetical protein HPB50_009870 [Hyalomma asiaticum]